MASVSTYLNFKRETEAAFMFYKSIFGGEFEGGLMRFGDMKSEGDAQQYPEGDKDLVMHVCLPILAGHRLMGTDAPESMGFTLTEGNNVYINLEPDTRAETDQLFAALADGGTVEQELQEMFWGDYFGSLTDKFGIKWMFNCAEKK